MKKTYIKPVFAVEEFALTQQISACSYLKIGMNSSECVKTDSDKATLGYSHVYSLALQGYFWDAGCSIHGSFAKDTDMICYHTSANMAFTS